MVRFPCPVCGTTITAPDEMIGYTSKCSCGEMVRVPRKNPFDEATEERKAPPKTAPKPVIHRPSAAPISTPSTGELIYCYACKKQVADNAVSCPKCGAIQTPEGREQGRRYKKNVNIATAIVVCVLLSPLVLCGLAGMFGKKNTDAVNTEHPGWDMERVRRDSDEVARDPSKEMFVPSDGSQPYIVPTRP